MSVLATDNFNRADSDPIGGNWTTIGGVNGLRVTSNALANSTSDTDSAAYYNAISWPADQYCKATMTVAGGTANDGGPLVRAATGAETFYYFNNNFSNQNKVYKAVAGAFTQLNVVNTTTWAANDVPYMEIQGTAILTKLNATTENSFTDSSIASGNVALFIFDGTMRLDNFEGGDFSTGTAAATFPSRTLRGAGV